MRRLWFFGTTFKKHFLLVLFFCSSLWATGCKSDISEGSELREAAISEKREETSSPEKESDDPAHGIAHIYVHVCGEVCSPGVYELESGSRVYEAVEAAGGMTGEAAADLLNQAEALSDGQQVYIPSVTEAEERAADTRGAQAADDGRVDLNMAGKEELMTLPGIGEVKAEAILRYREEKGRFASVEELKEVEGIKEGVFGKVKDKVKAS